MPMKPLTAKQQKVFDFLKTYFNTNAFPPTLKEIGDAIGLANINGVRGHLQALQKKGYITKSPDRARSIRIIYDPSPVNRLKRKLHEVLRTDEGVFHQITYGIAWSTWQRRPVLRGEVADRVAEAVDREVQKRGWHLREKRIQPDHIILIVNTWPNHSPERAVRRFQNACKPVSNDLPANGSPQKAWGKGYVATTNLDLLCDMVGKMLNNQENI